MRIAKEDVPVRIDVPGATARQIRDFGDATGYGKIGGEYFSLAAGTDTEMILFSPQHEHSEVIEHILDKLES